MDEASGSVKAFNRNDEQFLEAFAIFCGLGIQNTQMYEAVERAMAKQEVTLEVRPTASHVWGLRGAHGKIWHWDDWVPGFASV